jgi:hypothetical protein
MFPQGFITSQNDICHVNFDHQALTYILDQFQLFKKEQYFNGNKEKAITYHSTVAMPLDPFHDKQGMIVLREELEYFIVAIAEKPTLTCLKNECTQAMIKQDQIFDSLMESTAHKETSELLTDATNVQAEHQLIDLLCQAGFTKQDRWAHRWMESNKMYISSISVVAIQYRNRLFVGQKLMMFWRKPAVSSIDICLNHI